jgi:hypothetical protein
MAPHLDPLLLQLLADLAHIARRLVDRWLG